LRDGAAARFTEMVTIPCAMPSTGLLTADDIDEISRFACDADLEADTGYALMVAAETAEQAGDLQAAQVLAERAIDAHRAQGDPDSYPRAFRAGLLLRLGLEDAAMGELTALRPLLTQDPDAVAYLTEALQAGGRAETAEQWLTVALSTALQHRQELGSQRGAPDYIEAAAVAFMLAQCRHWIRGNLDLPHDDYDYLADRLMSALQAAIGADEPDYESATLLFWPRPEFGRLLLRWPSLAEEYGRTWDEHRVTVQKTLLLWSESSGLRLALLPGSVAELAVHAEHTGGDPTDPQVRQDYAQQLVAPAQEIAWPPGRNHSCWCGSSHKYKKCCLPRTRA
jgi:tetratricopeptide (TPR) repeat protein